MARADEDYTEFIMKVINAVIEVSQDHSNDHKDRTLFEKFQEFNYTICALAEKK